MIFIPWFTTNATTSVNFPWLSGDVPRLPSYGVYISTVACRKVSSAVLGQNDILMFFGPDSPFLAPHKIAVLNSKYFICYT